MLSFPVKLKIPLNYMIVEVSSFLYLGFLISSVYIRTYLVETHIFPLK